MDDDWGLYAIVRSCNKITTAPKPTTTPPPSSFTSPNPDFQNQFHLQIQNQNQNQNPLFFPDPLPEPRNLENVESLQDLLLKPIFPKFQNNIPISPLSVIGGLQDQQTHEIHPSPKSKRRKHQQKKKVCHVPAEGLSSDMWSWRKYGQKPIKGSPYPRGYYRCSTSKICLARKQVERNRSDPSMFILTYTGEHSHPMPTHRNSLAGSTRQKPASTDTDSPISSPAETVTEQKLDEEDEFGNTMISDDFFEGLEDSTGVMTGNSFSDGLPFLVADQ